MEIEVELDDIRPWAWIATGLLVWGVFSMVLGWWMTAMLPEARVFTWQDWYVFKVRRQVLTELQNLREDYMRLYQAVESGDPIRVTVIAEELLHKWEDGSTATVAQRQSLSQAAQVALAWTQGQVTQDEMWAALEKARGVLNDADATVGSRAP